MALPILRHVCISPCATAKNIIRASKMRKFEPLNIAIPASKKIATAAKTRKKSVVYAWRSPNLNRISIDFSKNSSTRCLVLSIKPWLCYSKTLNSSSGLSMFWIIVCMVILPVRSSSFGGNISGSGVFALCVGFVFSGFWPVIEQFPFFQSRGECQ